MSARLIETDTFAATMRARIVRPQTRELLISRIAGSDQEVDLAAPVNCGGLGRLRHFRRATAPGWPPNPLPIDPATRALGRPPAEELRTQLFQNAACAWRCWYCFVPFNLLNGDPARGEWTTAERLIELYRNEPDAPDVIDLSGGSPDLSPEWVVWTMEALSAAGLAESTYLWSDDNLSTDYVFSVLDDDARERLASYRNYGRVCCFKGFDEASFAFNTQADPSAFEAQFERFGRYLDLGLDLYGYVTLTGPEVTAASRGIPDLLDRLQRIHENLPLRVTPLRIDDFTPTRERDERGGQGRFAAASAVQEAAIAVWASELERRFPAELRSHPVVDVPMGARR